MLFFSQLIHFIFQIYSLMIFIRIIASWVPQFSHYWIMRFIAYYTDPYLNLFRRFIPPIGMFDFSPIIAILCLSFVQDLIFSFLRLII